MLNLIQSRYTQLIDDEAYYWVYSKFLAWGYYDHPPMIAIFIKIGYAIFHNELGVRLLMVAASTASIFLLEKIVAPDNKKIFYAIVLNVAVLQFAGFIAVPDIPLLFFVIVYFYRYKIFLKTPNLMNTLYWGISMSLMLYSKYHGILIIFFTLLSNLKLFKTKQIYIAGLLGILIFSPHLLWQFNHGFPSVYYHIWDRNTTPYQINYTTDYIAGQLALAGPILGWLFLWSLIKYKSANNLLHKAMQFSAIGFYAFFLLSSLHGSIEANWTIPALSCIVVIAYFYFVDKLKWHKLIYYAGVASFILVICIRFILLTDAVDIPIPIVGETKGNPQWASSIKKMAANKPVVFLNSYQLPSKYWFYSGDTSFAINTPSYRQNNYNIWGISKNSFNKNIALVTMQDYDSAAINFSTSKGNAIIKMEDSIWFQSNCLFYIDRKINVQANQSFEIKGKQYGEIFNSLPTQKIFLQIQSVDNSKTNIICNKIINGSNGCTLYFSTINLPKGSYTAKIAIATSINTIATLNSNTININVQ